MSFISELQEQNQEPGEFLSSFKRRRDAGLQHPQFAAFSTDTELIPHLISVAF